MSETLIEFKGQKLEYEKDKPEIYRVVSVLQITKPLEGGRFLLASLSNLHEIKIQIEYAIRRMELMNSMRF